MSDSEPEPHVRPVTNKEIDSKMKDSDLILARTFTKLYEVLKEMNRQSIQDEAADIVDEGFDQRSVPEKIASIHKLLERLQTADLPEPTLEDEIASSPNRLQIEVGRTLIEEIGIPEITTLHEANYKFTQLGELCAIIDRGVLTHKDKWPGAENMLSSRYAWFGTRKTDPQSGKMLYAPVNKHLRLNPGLLPHFDQLYTRFTDAYAAELSNELNRKGE